MIKEVVAEIMRPAEGQPAPPGRRLVIARRGRRFRPSSITTSSGTRFQGVLARAYGTRIVSEAVEACPEDSLAS